MLTVWRGRGSLGHGPIASRALGDLSLGDVVWAWR